MSSKTASTQETGKADALGDAQASEGAGAIGPGMSERSKDTPGLQQTLLDHDVRGEKSIAMAQAAICAFIVTLYFGALASSSLQTVNFWVPAILVGLIVTSLLRYLAARKNQFHNWVFELINLIDIAIYLSLIWSYQFSYDMNAGSVLKAPSMTFLFVMIGLRA